MHIPFMDLKRQYNSIKPEIDAAIADIIENTSFIGGPVKDNFEKQFAKALGVKHCIGVGNGTDSLFLILKALMLPPGSEVLVPANSFIATSEAVTLAGHHPIFVDIDPLTMNMDLRLVEKIFAKRSHKHGGKLRAVMPVHLYGRIVDMPRLLDLAKHEDIFVIEDTAQAHLAEIKEKKAGTFGIAGSFSFYPGKNLGAYGDGGCVVTDNDDLAVLIRKIANHGRVKKYDHDIEGINSRLDTLQAAILSVKLKYLENWTAQRREKAKIYDKLLAGSNKIIRPEIPAGSQHSFHLYVIRVKNRDDVVSKLNEVGIDTIVHYPIILPQLAAYSRLKIDAQKDFPIAHEYQSQILSLPLFPEITHEEQDYVAKNLISFV